MYTTSIIATQENVERGYHGSAGDTIELEIEYGITRIGLHKYWSRLGLEYLAATDVDMGQDLTNVLTNEQVDDIMRAVALI